MKEFDLIAFWKRVDDATDLLADTLARSNSMDRIGFGIFCCVIMEEFCEAHSLDVIEFAQWIADNIETMNAENGNY